jgi:two-component sensor histidine kinase
MVSSGMPDRPKPRRATRVASQPAGGGLARTAPAEGADWIAGEAGERAAPSAATAAAHEMRHRVKNILAMAMAITSQSLSRATSIPEARTAVEQRLMALADALDVLGESGDDASGLRRVVEHAVAPYDSLPSRFHLDGGDPPLASQPALALAMVLHELCTNAVRHGALSCKEGRVDIAWRAQGERLLWSWRETGGPPAQAPARRGFGLRVIEASFRDQLHGSTEISFEARGFACAVDLPLTALRAVRR